MSDSGRAPRAIVLVLDSVGAGELPDAAEYGDVGSNTLSNTSRAVGGLTMPVLGAMGLGKRGHIHVLPLKISGDAPEQSFHGLGVESRRNLVARIGCGGQRVHAVRCLHDEAGALELEVDVKPIGNGPARIEGEKDPVLLQKSCCQGRGQGPTGLHQDFL